MRNYFVLKFVTARGKRIFCVAGHKKDREKFENLVKEASASNLTYVRFKFFDRVVSINGSELRNGGYFLFQPRSFLAVLLRRVFTR